MTKLMPFTLIYQSHHQQTGDLRLESEAKSQLVFDNSSTSIGDAPDTPNEFDKYNTIKEPEKSNRAQRNEKRRIASELFDPIQNLNPKLKQTLLASCFEQISLGSDEDQAREDIEIVIGDLQRHKNVITVGLWDVNAWVGQLPAIVKVLNEAQPHFTFFELLAPLPSGLISAPERLMSWLRPLLHKQKKRLTKKIREELHYNIIFDDFYKHAKTVHGQTGVAHLVGITQNRIAGCPKDKPPYWNYYTASRKKTHLISVYKLREYAAQAGRTFEAAVAMLIIAELLFKLNSNKELKYHEDRGCLFDFIHKDENMINSLKELKIEDSCLALIDNKYRQTAIDVIKALRNYQGEEKKEKSARIEIEDETEWIEKLIALGRE